MADSRSAAGNDAIDHAESVGFGGGEPIGGEEEFLGLAGTEFEGMGEIFDAAHAHGDGVVLEKGVFGGDDEVAGPDEHETAGDALAVDLRNGGLGDGAPAFAEAEVELELARDDGFGAG